MKDKKTMCPGEHIVFFDVFLFLEESGILAAFILPFWIAKALAIRKNDPLDPLNADGEWQRL